MLEGRSPSGTEQMTGILRFHCRARPTNPCPGNAHVTGPGVVAVVQSLGLPKGAAGGREPHSGNQVVEAQAKPGVRGGRSTAHVERRRAAGGSSRIAAVRVGETNRIPGHDESFAGRSDKPWTKSFSRRASKHQLGFEIAVSRIAFLVVTGEFVLPVVGRAPLAIATLQLGRRLPARHGEQDPHQRQGPREPRPAAGPRRQTDSVRELPEHLNPGQIGDLKRRSSHFRGIARLVKMKSAAELETLPGRYLISASGFC